jgi:large subunit ribosomal protein L9
MNIKVILLQNVPKLGQKGDVKSVSEGYARNFLIPQNEVKLATGGEVKNIVNKKNAENKKEEVLHNKVKTIFSKLGSKEVVITEKANEKGHLFAQVHLKEIADAISELGFDISEDWINLKDPIKEVGEFDIQLEAFGEKGRVKLKIEAK